MTGITLGPPGRSTTRGAMVHSIRDVGPDRCGRATDCGPAPVAGMRIFVQRCRQRCWQQRISETEIRTMVADNPARLRGLD